MSLRLTWVKEQIISGPGMRSWTPTSPQGHSTLLRQAPALPGCVGHTKLPFQLPDPLHAGHQWKFKFF